MKKISYILLSMLVAVSTSSCTAWLTEEAPGKTNVEDFLSSEEAAIQQATGVYVPLAWEYGTDFYAEWTIGDVCSDDALKGGGSEQDGAGIFDMENFQTTSNNTVLLNFYRTQYQGIGRANAAIEMIGEMSSDYIGDELRARLIGEIKFLRAYYYFRLVRVFGGVPLVTTPLYSSDDWKQPRATAEAIYGQIVKDLEEAEPDLWLKSEYDASDLGRATKGAAQAMLLKVNLYRHNYDEAYKWGTTFMEEQAAEYDLNPEYLYNFAIEGENGIESVFEVQYVEEGTSDWGSGIPNGADGATRGNMSTVWTRPRNTNTIVVDRDSDSGATILAQKGYGYNRPSVDLYNEFEAGDPRREYTIIDIPDSDIQNQAEEIYLGNRYINRKQSGYYYDNGNYSLYYKLDHDTRSPVNRREIRFSDVLLLYAEACLESGKDLDKGAAALNRVRDRVGLGQVSLTEDNLRHERRVELAMEGHRWFDLCRWGIVGDTMNAYRAKYMDENSGTSYEGTYMREFVKGKHELFPIPYEEVRLSGLTQNPGY